MSRRTTGGTLAAWMIIAAIVGFAGGAFAGTQSDSDNTPRTEPTSSNSPTAEAAKTPAPGIQLKAKKDSVNANQRLDLEGQIRPAAEGVALQLERNVDGAGWEAFPIDPFSTDASGKFSTWVQSGRSGKNQFRVVQVDDEAKKSNTVAVTIS